MFTAGSRPMLVNSTGGLMMRVVALEEHFTVPALVRRISAESISRRGFSPRRVASGRANPLELLPELGEKRLGSMDEAGITVQVLSTSGPGADLVDGEEGVALARETNDFLAEVVARRPDRFAGFAHLPMRRPDAAAKELARSVRDLGFHGALINGTTEDRFLDDARFEPILAAAEALDVPLYLHPHLAPEAVRRAYYGNLPSDAGVVLEAAGWGWHSETAIHVLRLVLAGTFDRHPKLKLIIGHMGEGLPVMLARCDQVFEAYCQHLARPVSRTILDQVWITTSGIFTEPPFLAALLTFGIDRILFSVDYPFAPNEHGRAFLQLLSLSPMDRAKLAHGNADRLLRLAGKTS
jgi:predicted TIM-barrel fold metal-dependent hydrolase